MVNDWPLVSLKDAAQFFSGGTPPKSKPEYWGGDIPWISAKSMKGSRFNDSDLKLTEAGLKKGSRLAPKDSILLLVRGSMLHQRIPVGIVTKNVAFNQDVKAIVPNEKFLPLYFYYCFAGREQELLSKVENTGIGAGKLDTAVLNKIEFYCPPLPEQKAIAHILGALDDKIELNRQMNETLEAMAQALFKSWFVDFDPVIDNALAAGNSIPDELFERIEKRKEIQKSQNQGDQAIRSLFPNEFNFSEEIGWIPKGWDEVQIKDIARVIKGVSYKSSELTESQSALVTLKSFKRGGGYRLDGLKEYIGKYNEEQEVKAGDLVIAYTDVTQAADLIGKPAMVIEDTRYKHLVISLDVAVVRPEIDNHKYFLYGLAKTEAFQSHNYSHSTGTTVLHLSKNAVPDYRLCLPSNSILDSYTNIVKPLFVSINNNIAEMTNLEKIRDTLLPKLMSGEIRISDAAAFVEDV